MPAHDNHTRHRHIPSAPASRRTAPRPDPRTRRGRVTPSTAPSVARPVGAPATVWAPPIHATGQAWTDWLHATVRAAFLPPQGCWWDMTAALVGLPPVDPPERRTHPVLGRPHRPGVPADLDTGRRRRGRSAYRRRGSQRRAIAHSTSPVRSHRHRSTSPSPTSPPPVKPSTGGSGCSPPSRCAAAESWPFSPAATTNPHQAGRSSTRPAPSSPPPRTPTFSTCSTSSSPPAPSSPHARTRRVSPPKPPDRGDLDAHDRQDITHIDLLVFAQPHKYGLHTGTPTSTSTNGADDLRDDQPSAIPVRAGGDAR